MPKIAFPVYEQFVARERKRTLPRLCSAKNPPVVESYWLFIK